MEKKRIDCLKKASTYGLGEFLGLINALSEESTKQDLLDKKQKELITLGMALAKGCQRCIDVHTEMARKLGASEFDLLQVRKISLYIAASPDYQADLWQAWKDTWREFSLSKGGSEHHSRELIALGIAIVRQHARLIELHIEAAMDAGVTADEIFEVILLALLMDGAPALAQIPQVIYAVERSQQMTAMKAA